MLQWVSEFEAKEGTKKKMRCPACKGRIRVVEPYDPIVRFNDRLFRAWSRAAPPFLLVMFTMMAGAGSGYYGAAAFTSFAGTEHLHRWMRFDSLMRRPARSILLSEKLAFTTKFLALQMIAPSLLIYKALPFLKSFGALSAMILGVTIGWRQQTPRWPPTAGWTVAVLPFITWSYNNLYRDFFGHFERRLDLQLRGRDPDEEAAAQPPPNIQRQERAQQPAGRQQPAQGQPAAGADQQDRGLLGTLWGLARAAFGLLALDDDEEDQDQEVLRIDLEINVGDGDEADADFDGDGQLEEIVIVDQGDGAATPPNPQVQAEVEEEQQDGTQENAVEANQPAVPAAPENAEQPAEAQNAPAARMADRVEDLTTNIFTRILNATASQLMLPFVCAAAGEVLRVTLPTRLVVKTRWGQPGLLQQQWGRSLVGGGLFIVARDMAKLYGKYRRLQVKSRRKVKNVPRRKKGKKIQPVAPVPE